MTPALTFDAVDEARPGPAWRARWDATWPDYRAWFLARDRTDAPDRAQAEAALARHMPELVPVHTRLTRLAGGRDLEARFLATWCPPPYLGGCSVAAQAEGGAVRLVRNYDLSPELNEGLLLRSAWTGRPVMGMVEFLWGLSDGINAAGLAVALAFGGRGETAPGFGICTLLRYVLETCADVPAALAVLGRVPSHMAYNVVLADAAGRTASVELHPGGGATAVRPAIAANHQHGPAPADRPGFTRTLERRAHLERMMADGTAPGDLAARFLAPPLRQGDYAGGFGTLFTADYDPVARAMRLLWPGTEMAQSLADFRPGRRRIVYDQAAPTPLPDLAALVAAVPEGRRAAFDRWLARAAEGPPDWAAFGALFHRAPG
ncbi:hypothetical protein DXV76_11740 [Rhodobacteraceae bacterium CCMM004]|nr:hypothetical protein DXV76_11740 [Rhodobacteraceae bacterium CCMM004]